MSFFGKKEKVPKDSANSSSKRSKSDGVSEQSIQGAAKAAVPPKAISAPEMAPIASSSSKKDVDKYHGAYFTFLTS